MSYLHFNFHNVLELQRNNKEPPVEIFILNKVINSVSFIINLHKSK